MEDINNIKTKDEPPAKETDNLAQIIKREIKTYVLRAGRMTAAQQKAYDELAPSWCIPFEKKLLNFVDVFGNTNPIIVEIGFGMGDATVAIAEANPNITPNIVNKIKKLAPITTSGETINTLFNDNNVLRIFLFFTDTIPIAPSVPIIVAIKPDNNATNNVFSNITIKRGSSNTAL